MNYNELLTAIRAASPRIIGLDGRCCSGKTTLATRLAADLGAAVFHLDDYFLRPEQRSPERRAIPGENVDHERFETEVLLPLQAGTAPVTQRFDCKTLRLLPPVLHELRYPAICEGSYALNKALRPYYDLTILTTCSPETQMQRLALREPAEKLEAFRTMWIPLEERWFGTLSEGDADILLATDTFAIPEI
ncbi:MAG: uridine kinase [Clostridia bacterium]|nr:uridine kinase [Clostridia bacterium]